MILQKREEHTRNENILIWSPNELHGLLCKDSHILIRSVAGNVFIRTVVESDENIQEYFL